MLGDGTRIDADMIIVGIGAIPAPNSPQRPASRSTTESSSMSTCAPPIRTSSPPATSPTHTTRVWGGTSASSTGPTPGAKAPLPPRRCWAKTQPTYDRRISSLISTTSAWSTPRDIGPAGYDRVIFRRYADSSQMIVFWLYEQRVQAGMNINIWDVAEDIERLILSARPINAESRRSGHPAGRLLLTISVSP